MPWLPPGPAPAGLIPPRRQEPEQRSATDGAEMTALCATRVKNAGCGVAITPRPRLSIPPELRRVARPPPFHRTLDAPTHSSLAQSHHSTRSLDRGRLEGMTFLLVSDT